MSDFINDPAPSSAPAGGLAPDALAAHRDHWVSQGLDPAAFDAAVAGVKPAATPTPPPTPVAQAPGRDPAAAREHIAYLRQYDQGLTDEKIISVLTANGWSPDEAAAACGVTAADARPDDQKELERGGLTPATNPAEYAINYGGRIVPGTAPETMIAADNEVRDFLVAIGAPAITGGSIAETLIDAAQAYDRMSPADQATYKVSQKALFERVCGGREAADEAMAKVGSLLAKAPAFAKDLFGTGALHSAMAVALLANVAKVNDVRSGVAGGKTLRSFMGG